VKGPSKKVDKKKIQTCIHHNSTNLMALICAADEAICWEAVDQLESGGDEVGAVQLAAVVREDAIKRWEAKHKHKVKDADKAVPKTSTEEALQRMPILPPKAIPSGLRVVVLGAGVAGLKAAADLECMGAQVTVLEARDRIGGRIHSYTFEKGAGSSPPPVVDLGATFICGTSLEPPPVNPIFTFIRQLGIQTVPKHRSGPHSNAWFDSSGVLIPSDDTDRAERLSTTILQELMDLADSVDSSFSIQSGVENLLETHTVHHGLRDDDLKLFWAFNADLYNATMDQLSLKGMVSEGYSGDHELVIGGYKQVVEALADVGGPRGGRLGDVRLGQEVQKVELNSSGRGVKVYFRASRLPTPQHLNTSALTSQRLNTSIPTPQHLNNGAIQNLNTTLPQDINNTTLHDLSSAEIHGNNTTTTTNSDTVVLHDANTLMLNNLNTTPPDNFNTIASNDNASLPSIMNTTTLNDINATAPTDTNTSAPQDFTATAPHDPNSTPPTDPNNTAPADPNTTAPTDPDTTAPTDMDTSAPQDSTATAPTDPNTTAPIDPNTTAPRNVDTLEPHGSNIALLPDSIKNVPAPMEAPVTEDTSSILIENASEMAQASSNGNMNGVLDTEDEAPNCVVEADAVICTLPLGVLQHALTHNSLTFQPPLPQFKQDAITSLAMGTENRVAMLFPRVFWDAKSHFLRPVSGDYTFANNHALGVKNVLCAWVRPHAVDKLESMSPQEAMDDVEKTLRLMYPTSYCKPAQFKVTYWKSDPYARGAYTYVPVGTSKDEYDRMMLPITGDDQVDQKDALVVPNGGRPVVRAESRLYFAGEGTIKSDAYTVHGAFMSGRREASRVGKWWQTHSNS